MVNVTSIVLNKYCSELRWDHALVRTDSWLVCHQEPVTCPSITLSCTCEIAKTRAKLKHRKAEFFFLDTFSERGVNVFHVSKQYGKSMLRVTFPVQLSTLLRTCMPDERRSVPSTEPCSSEPASAPGLWPSAVCEAMLPLLLQLLHHTYEASSDCSAPQCAPAEMRCGIKMLWAMSLLCLCELIWPVQSV